MYIFCAKIVQNNIIYLFLIFMTIVRITSYYNIRKSNNNNHQFYNDKEENYLRFYKSLFELGVI